MDARDSSDIVESSSRRSLDDVLAEMRARDTSSGLESRWRSKPRPWVRYWARMIDVGLFGIPVSIMAILINPAALDGSMDLMLLLMTLNLWIFVESGLLATWGSTPGKALLQVRVRESSGSKLRFPVAIARSARVWLFGLGAGIPLVSVVTAWWSYRRLSRDGQARWDQEGEIVIRHGRIGGLRVLVAVAFLGGLALVTLLYGY